MREVRLGPKPPEILIDSEALSGSSETSTVEVTQRLGKALNQISNVAC